MKRVVIEQWEIWPDYRLPVIECPNCGQHLLGNSPHEVTASGEVNASVVCNSCDFHEFIMLKDWKGGRITKANGENK